MHSCKQEVFFRQPELWSSIVRSVAWITLRKIFFISAHSCLREPDMLVLRDSIEIIGGRHGPAIFATVLARWRHMFGKSQPIDVAQDI